MNIKIGQIVNVTDNFKGKDLSNQVGVIDKIDTEQRTPYPIRVKFNDGGSGWYRLHQISSHADTI